jgi:hypothetical protein
MTAAHADLELHRGENHERRMAMRRLRRNGAQLRRTKSRAQSPMASAAPLRTSGREHFACGG